MEMKGVSLRFSPFSSARVESGHGTGMLPHPELEKRALTSWEVCARRRHREEAELYVLSPRE